MRNFLTILLFYSCSVANPSFTPSGQISLPKDYVYNWTTGDETGIKQFEIQDSINGKWITFDSIKPKGRGNYTYVLPAPTTSSYWRLKSVGYVTYYTKSIRVTLNNVTITNAIRKTSTLVWTVSNAMNVDYFLIEKTSDNKTYSQVTKATFKANGTYSYRYSKTVKKYSYRLTAVYKDGSKSKLYKF